MAKYGSCTVVEGKCMVKDITLARASRAVARNETTCTIQRSKYLNTYIAMNGHFIDKYVIYNASIVWMMVNIHNVNEYVFLFMYIYIYIYIYVCIYVYTYHMYILE